MPRTAVEASWDGLGASRTALEASWDGLEASRTALEASWWAVQDRPGRQASKTLLCPTDFGPQNGTRKWTQNDTGDFVKIVFPPQRQYDF